MIQFKKKKKPMSNTSHQHKSSTQSKLRDNSSVQGFRVNKLIVLILLLVFVSMNIIHCKSSSTSYEL